MKISKTKYFLLALILIFSFSCSPEDGSDGADGIDGIDGVDGADGADGADGNANVQTFTFDTSTESGTGIDISIPEITQDVLDNDAILSYYWFNSPGFGDFYYPMPGAGQNGNFVTRIFMELGEFNIRFHDWDGTDYSIDAGEVDGVKIIIIESSSSTTSRNNAKKVSPKQQVEFELNQAGVDINDYYAVCDYYGIAY